MPGFEIFDDEEKREVMEVMETGILFRYGFENARNNIYKAKAFEDLLKYKFKTKFAHLCSSGTSALISMLNSCGIGYGDEVIVPPFTFVATIESILLLGAKPVFSEINKTLCLCPDKLSNAITKRTKAVLPVHMCGSMAEIDKIDKFCKNNKLILLEDVCQAIGGSFNGKFLGTFGLAGVFSFDFVKTITCGEGGAVITNSKDIYIGVDSYTDHGHDHIGNDRGAERHLTIGNNFRINELNAAIGLAQLKKIDKIIKIQKKYKAIIENCLKFFKEIEMRQIPDEIGDTSTFISFLVPNVDIARKIIVELKKIGIDNCFHWFDNNWHYIKQWNHIKNFKKYLKLPLSSDYLNVNLPISDKIIKRTISVQIKIGWKRQEVDIICDNIFKILSKCFN